MQSQRATFNAQSWGRHNAAASQYRLAGAISLNTPVRVVTPVEEPTTTFINDPEKLFGSWIRGKPFGLAAWYSRRIPYFQAVGDPFVKR